MSSLPDVYLSLPKTMGKKLQSLSTESETILETATLNPEPWTLYPILETATLNPEPYTLFLRPLYSDMAGCCRQLTPEVLIRSCQFRASGLRSRGCYISLDLYFAVLGLPTSWITYRTPSCPVRTFGANVECKASYDTQGQSCGLEISGFQRGLSWKAP